jgi:Xaa-Pro aminopeptidase
MSGKLLNKVSKLTAQFEKYEIKGYIVPSYDEFRNEYVPSHLQRLSWLTGFTGSNGILILNKEQLFFMTDSRYTIQAKTELSNKFQILDMTDANSWARVFSSFKEGEYIGYDPMIESISTFARYHRLCKAHSVKLKPINENLVDLIWVEKLIPNKKGLLKLSIKEAGESSDNKIALAIKNMNNNSDYLLVNNLSLICWLLNIRGNDIKNTPLILGYLVICRNGKCYLFSDSIKDPLENVQIFSLSNIRDFFINLIISGAIIEAGSDISIWFKEIAQEALKVVENTLQLTKATKNTTEIANIKRAHFEDGVALCKFIIWLAENFNSTDEIAASEQLLYFRKQSDIFIEPSFDTISAFGSNGAIIHYKPSKETNQIITNNNLYLLDSGGQYKFGTTDVTRTFCFGKATAEQKKHYTLVLKGMMRLSMLKFPLGTNGAQLDSLARLDLWMQGLDYPHSTGHGVGYFLSVHEGPQSISKLGTIAMAPCMVLSNEPGYYKEGEYGIRIENLMLVKESKTKGFLEFETLTMAPIMKNLVDLKLLNEVEKNWLDNYNMTVFNKVGKILGSTQRNKLQTICDY